MSEVRKPLKGVTSEKTSSYTRALFEKHYEQLPEDMQAKFESGAWETEDVNYYQTRIAAGETTIKVFSTTQDKEAGLCNFPKAKSEASKPFIITALQFDYSKAPNTDKAFKITDFPDDFLQGEMVLKIGGKEKARIPLQRFASPDASTSSNINGSCTLIYNLVNPKWVIGEKDVLIEIELYKALAPAGGTDQHQVRVTLIGVGATNTAD